MGITKLKQDLTGQKFGKWTVLSFKETNKNRQNTWNCICECGTKRSVSTTGLITKRSTSCNCGRVHDLIGKKFDKLFVIKEEKREFISGRIRRFYLCQCDCGKTIVKKVENLKAKRRQSCGCIKSYSHREYKPRKRRLKPPNLINQKFNRLLVISLNNYQKPHYFWNCLCDCGKNIIVETHELIRKTKGRKSCGCLWEETKTERLKQKFLNKRFNKLIVIKQSNKKGFWNCLCDCGKEIIVFGAALKTNNTKSCGCSKPKGENSYQWNPNKTDEERIIQRKYTKYTEWRNSVYQRDNYICQITNTKSRNLCAHHLFSYHSHKDLRLDINNGITICKEIHKLFHKIYGNKNNTPEQFYEFKERYNKGEFNIKILQRKDLTAA